MSIHYFLIDHNAPCLPTKILHNYCFQFLLGITVVPREIQDNGYVKFWGVNTVRYGLCENSEFCFKSHLLPSHGILENIDSTTGLERKLRFEN